MKGGSTELTNREIAHGIHLDDRGTLRGSDTEGNGAEWWGKEGD